MSNGEAEVSKVKGRPFLNWVGKKPLERVKAFPAQHIETFDPTGSLEDERVGEVWRDWPSQYPRGGLLFHGENKEVLGHLLANGFRGKVRLVYIDPPFMSNADYVRKVKIRGERVEINDPSVFQQQIYTDIWQNDNYLQFMYERLQLLKELLTEDGSIYVHVDPHKSHYIKVVMDEIFGEENFRNEIVWCYTGPSNVKKDLPGKHDIIFRYSKSDERIFNKDAIRIEYVKRDTGATKGIFKERALLPEEGKVPEDWWKDNDDTSWSDYDWWEDVTPVARLHATVLTGFTTQKPPKLLERIILASTYPGDIVLDSFVGSGTAAIVAQQMNRRWIACDMNKQAVQLASSILQNVIKNQTQADQTAFTVWRVNDYDLQIQHNEFVNLACDYIGVQRTKTDVFFDGTLGDRLVKIIPVQHPLSPLDLEEIKQELENRKEEGKDIVVVCLGKELAADAWLEDWNRLRKAAGLNRIDVIELKTDPKYGGLMKHEPATAKVEIQREGDMVQVEIIDLISPSIIKRLSNNEGVLMVTIDDWRAMVDCVLIDAAYNGEVFNIVVSDVPEKRNDVVKGVYEFESRGRVAVKIIDLLGEEVLVVEEYAA